MNRSVVLDLAALGRQQPGRGALRSGLALEDGLDPVVAVADGDLDGHRVATAAEQAAVQIGGVGHVEGVLEGGVQGGVRW